MYKIILIDIDDTIFDFKSGEAKALINTLNKFNIKYDDNLLKKFSDINEKYFQLYAKNEMTREQFHKARFDDLLYISKSYNDPIEVNKFYLENLAQQCEFVDGAKDVIQYLNDKYVLCIASNGKYEVQKQRLELAKIDKYFSKIYVSSQIGFNKPDKRFFDYIFNDLSEYKKSDFIIIGDREDSDILGAINSGIDSIYFDSQKKDTTLKSSYTIYNLEEIKNIL